MDCIVHVVAKSQDRLEAAPQAVGRAGVPLGLGTFCPGTQTSLGVSLVSMTPFLIYYTSCRIISLCHIVFYYTDTVFQKKRTAEIETSVVSSVTVKMTNGQVGGDLRKAWVAGNVCVYSSTPGSTGHTNLRLPRSQGGLSLLTGAGHPAGHELSLCPAE